MRRPAGPHGAARVYVADDPELAAPLSQPRVDVLAKAVQENGYDAVLLAQSVLAADVAAALAARLEAGLNWALTDLRLDDGAFVGVQPALSDSIYVDVGWCSTPAFALFRREASTRSPSAARPRSSVGAEPPTSRR